MIPCRICSAPTLEHDRARVRNRYETVFLRCETCGFVFLNEPTWLEEAYEEPINASDTGYVARNLGCSRMMRIFIERFLNPKGSFLDYAGGYGLFVRLMR